MTGDWPQSGGEMGGCIRAFDWSVTPLGPIDDWPERLRGMIDLLLCHHSAMVALVGPNLLQIYNDPYRDLMGARHPAGLGQPTRECWPEVWHINQPIYHRVLSGEAVAFDDKLFPIVRGDQTEDAWFSITYSPLHTARNGVDGVLVTVVETSARVRAESVRLETERRLTEGRELAGLTSDFRALFEGAPSLLLVIAPTDLTIVAANRAYRQATMTSDKDILGKSLFGVFPDDPADVEADGVHNLRASIAEVLATGAPHAMGVQRYPVRRPAEQGGGFEERWWDCVNSPLKGQDGEIALIIHGASDVTASQRAEIALRESEENHRQLFTSMEQAFCIIEKIATTPGEPSDFRFLAANPAYERHTGLRDVVGRTVLELLPDYDRLTMDAFDDVAATGRHHQLAPFISDLNSWFEGEALPGRLPGQVAVMFSNVTDRTIAAIALRQSEERQSYLLELSDALRELAEPAAIQGKACRLLGEHLGTDRAYYLEIDGGSDHTVVRQDYVRDDLLPSLVGEWSLATFGYILPLYRPGLPVLIPDVLTFDAMPETAKQETVAAGVRSYLSVPLIKEGELVGALIVADNQPRDWTQADARLVDDVAQRVWASVERGRAQTSLHDSEARQRALIEGVPQLVWRSNSGGDRTWTSPQWTEYTGRSEADSLGHGWLEVVHPDDRQLVLDAWSSADVAGVLAVNLRVYHALDDRYRWSAVRARPRRDDNGTIVEWLGTTTDIDEMRQMQDAQQVMVSELQHRTRNLIAIVRSVAQQTMRGSTGFPEFQVRFNDRLAALGRVQGLLSRSELEPITIGAIVRMELDALGALSLGDRVHLQGPEVPLRNAVVQTLSLALHELATNARKYGSMATDHGKLRVTWRVDSDGDGRRTLSINWLEKGLDPSREIKSPATSGYGRELIERALPYTLGAKTKYELGDDDVHCSIELPLDREGGG